MEMLFLGTSSMVPTKERNHAGLFLMRESEGILFDCGEGIQRQLKIAGISLTKVSIVLISHWHGDHVLGLPGLVQTMGSMDYPGKLRIFGPKGTKKRFNLLKKAFVFEDRIEVEVFDIAKKNFFSGAGFNLEALPLDHSTDCLGYSLVEDDKRRIREDVIQKLGIPFGPMVGSLQEGKTIKIANRTIKPDDVSFIEKGKRISYITDTAVCKNAVDLAKDADLLVCESTYADDLEDKAAKYRHLTARQAAFIATKAGVKKLVLTHFSQRYKDISEIEENAKTVFSNVICAYDFMRLKI